MTTRILSLLFNLLLCLGLAAQVTPKATLTMEGGTKDIFLHDFTGVAIVQTTKTYAAINPETSEKLWEMDRNQTSATMEALGSEGPMDYFDLYQSPFAYVNGSVVNVLNGEAVVDGATEDIKSFITYYLIPEADLMIVELYAKGMARLYGLDPFKGTQKWGVDLREMGAIGGAIAAEPGSRTGMAPLTTAAGSLLYPNGKYLASIDLEQGKLQWNEKVNPGYIFLNKEATKVLVAEKRGAIGAAMNVGAAMGTGPQKFGKALHLLDAQTGESAWSKGETKMDGNVQFIMPYDGGFIVCHDEGMNIYDYTPGKEAANRWKKNYGEKGIRDVEITDEGLKVYTKNRLMLVDPATGEDVWKKPEKLEKERGLFAMGPARQPAKVGASTYEVTGGRIRIKTPDGTRSYDFNSYFVDEDRERLVVIWYEDISSLNYRYQGRLIDMNTGEVFRFFYKLRKELQGIDATANGYFFYNDRGFSLQNFVDGEVTEVRTEYYKDPAATERVLGQIATGLVATTAAVRTTADGFTDVISNDPNAIARYNARTEAIDYGSDVSNSLLQRRINGRVEDQYGYFFGKDDDKELTLFKIDKDTGETVKTYPFEETKPIYEIDSYGNVLYYGVDEVVKIFDL